MQASTLAAVPAVSQTAPTHRWTVGEVLALYEMPLMDLIWRAQGVHRENFDPNAIQRSALLSVKTGGCSEDCSYCSQSAATTRTPSGNA
jgi:biotin synthase